MGGWLYVAAKLQQSGDLVSGHTNSRRHNSGSPSSRTYGFPRGFGPCHRVTQVVHRATSAICQSSIGRPNQNRGRQGLLRLEVTAHKPSNAQGIANAVIGSWLKSSVPGEQDRAELERRLGFANDSLKSANDFLGRLNAQGATALNKPLTFGEAGLGMVAVGELQARYQADAYLYPISQGVHARHGGTAAYIAHPSCCAEKSVMAALAVWRRLGVALHCCCGFFCFMLGAMPQKTHRWQKNKCVCLLR